MRRRIARRRAGFGRIPRSSGQRRFVFHVPPGYARGTTRLGLLLALASCTMFAFATTFFVLRPH